MKLKGCWKKSQHKPKFLLLENVKNLVGKKFKNDFDLWLDKLSELGYNNYWKILNAKDYGIPQNRERVFVLSIRKDLDVGFEFPNKKELKTKFKDIAKEGLQIPNHILKSFYNKGGDFGKRFKTQNMDYGMCITTKNNWSVITNNFFTKDYKKYSIEEIYENNIPCFALNPKEYWNMMGFKDEEFEKAAKVCSNAQLCKQAGNSIVVDVLEAIFEQMIKFKYIER